jgi:hypothetical protein
VRLPPSPCPARASLLSHCPHQARISVLFLFWLRTLCGCAHSATKRCSTHAVGARCGRSHRPHSGGFEPRRERFAWELNQVLCSELPLYRPWPIRAARTPRAAFARDRDAPTCDTSKSRRYGGGAARGIARRLASARRTACLEDAAGAGGVSAVPATRTISAGAPSAPSWIRIRSKGPPT